MQLIPMPLALLIPESFASLATLREKQSSETEETHETTDLGFGHDPDSGQIIPTTFRQGPFF